MDAELLTWGADACILMVSNPRPHLRLHQIQRGAAAGLSSLLYRVRVPTLLRLLQIVHGADYPSCALQFCMPTS
jgi:hypothetical protein